MNEHLDPGAGGTEPEGHHPKPKGPRSGAAADPEGSSLAPVLHDPYVEARRLRE